MFRLRFGAALAAGAVIFLAAARAEAGFEEAVPADAMVFVGVDDVSALRADLESSAWGRFLQDPGFDGMWSYVGDRIREMGAAAKDETGRDPFELLEMVSGPAAVVVLDVADPELTRIEQERVPVALALMLGVGERGGEFLDAWHEMFEGAVEKGRVIRRNESLGDVDVYVLADADEDAEEPMLMRYGLTGDTFVMTFLSEELDPRADFARIVEGLGGEAEETLSDVPRFADSFAGVDAADVRVFVDVDRILERALAAAEAAGELDEDEMNAVQVVGLDALGALAVRWLVTAEESRSDMQLAWAGQGHLVDILRAALPAGSFVTPALVPPDPIQMNAFRLDLIAAIDAVLALMREIEPEMAAMAEQQMDMLFVQEEFNVRTDLLENLEGEISYYTAPVVDPLEDITGNEDDPQSFAVLIRLKDGGTFERALDGLIRSQGMHALRKREEFQGITVYTVPLPFGAIRYSVLPDLLVVSMSGELMHDVLRRHGDSDLPNLGGKEEFVEAVDRLGGGAVTGLSYSDAARSTKNLLEMGRALLAGQPLPGMPVHIDLDQEPPFTLPESDLIDKYFKGFSVGVTVIDAEGFRASAIGP